MEVAIAVSISVLTSSMKGYSSCRWTITLAPVEDTRKGLYSSSFMYKMTCSPGRIRQLVVVKGWQSMPGAAYLSLLWEPHNTAQALATSGRWMGVLWDLRKGRGWASKQELKILLRVRELLPYRDMPSTWSLRWGAAERGGCRAGESWAPAEDLAAGRATCPLSTPHQQQEGPSF